MSGVVNPSDEENFDDLLDDLADGRVVDLVRDALANDTLERLLRAAHAAPEFHEEVIVALVDVLGVEHARQRLNTTPSFAHVDVEAVLARAHSNAVIREAVERGAGVQELIDVLDASTCDDADRASWLQVIARRFPCAELARAAAQRPRRTALDLLRMALPNLDVLAAFEALARAVDVDDLARLSGPLGWCEEDKLPAALRVARVHGALLVAAGRSPSAALRWIDAMPLDAWLPVFQGLGLPASAAVLAVRERWTALAVIDVVRQLVAAGYRDDLLEGLRMNGLGVSSSMQHLARCGWRVDQMVDDLLRNGMLLPDVRDELASLGLPSAAIVDVLLRHAPAEVLELVMR